MQVCEAPLPFPRFNLDPSVDLRHLASLCPANTTGADLYSLCSEAALIALRKQIAELEAKGVSRPGRLHCHVF